MPPRTDGELGFAAYTHAKALMQQNSAPRPLSAEGRAVAKVLDGTSRALAEELRIWFELPAEGRLPLEDIVKFMADHDFIRKLGAARTPTRDFDGKWLHFQFPDTGEWKVTQDPASGLTRIDSARNIVGTTFTLSFAPMASDVDSRGYTDMFRERLAAVFSPERLPLKINGGLVSTWTQDAEPQYTGTVGDIECWHWYIESTTARPRGSLEMKQLEVHGMRREVEPTRHGRKLFGLNASMSAPKGIFDQLEPLFRDLLATVQIRPSDEVERILGRWWAQSA